MDGAGKAPIKHTKKFYQTHPNYQVEGSGLKSFLKGTEKFAKKSNIISTAALLSGNPAAAAATGMLGYGYKRKTDKPLTAYQMFVKNNMSDARIEAKTMLPRGTPREVSNLSMSILGAVWQEQKK